MCLFVCMIGERKPEIVKNDRIDINNITYFFHSISTHSSNNNSTDISDEARQTINDTVTKYIIAKSLSRTIIMPQQIRNCIIIPFHLASLHILFFVGLNIYSWQHNCFLDSLLMLLHLCIVQHLLTHLLLHAGIIHLVLSLNFQIWLPML